MSKYVIHACTERMWYVNGYLIPSMKKQDIKDEDISVACDTDRVGCLENCMKIFMDCNTDGGRWHLQDDIVICSDFKLRTERLSANTNSVLCGYCWTRDPHAEKTGNVTPEDMWWSFPCIYIPDICARKCARWFYSIAINEYKYSKYVRRKKFDDYFFKEYLLNCRGYTTIFNATPNLVDHIDYLIGGSMINTIRSDKETRALYFEDQDVVSELENNLKIYGKDGLP